MELINEIKKEINIDISKLANNALDFGLRAALPDFIEDDVIEIKNAFVNEGFISGIEETLKKIEDIVNSIKGLFKGEFESVEQIKRLIQKNGILDAASSLIDTISKKLLEKGIIDKTAYNMIKSGKNEILSSLETQLKKYYKEDEYSIEKLSQSCEEWKEELKKENYEGMKKSINKVKQRLEQSLIVENTIKEARNIEKMEKYIEKNGSLDNLTESQKNLLKSLTI